CELIEDVEGGDERYPLLRHRCEILGGAVDAVLDRIDAGIDCGAGAWTAMAMGDHAPAERMRLVGDEPEGVRAEGRTEAFLVARIEAAGYEHLDEVCARCGLGAHGLARRRKRLDAAA